MIEVGDVGEFDVDWGLSGQRLINNGKAIVSCKALEAQDSFHVTFARYRHKQARDVDSMVASRMFQRASQHFVTGEWPPEDTGDLQGSLIGEDVVGKQGHRQGLGRRDGARLTSCLAIDGLEFETGRSSSVG